MRVVAFLHQKVLRRLVEFEPDVFVAQAFDHLLHFQRENLDEVGLRERAEHDHVVDPVQKFRAESPPGLVQNPFAHLLVAAFVRDGREPERGLPFDRVRADVRGHQNDRVAKIHDVAGVVGQLALLQDLQQQIPNVRVRLFDFVEQHDGIRIAPDFLRKLAAFLVTDIAGRRTDEPRDVEFFHVFAHIEMNERFRVAEHLFRERFGEQGFSNTRRAEQ